MGDITWIMNDDTWKAKIENDGFFGEGWPNRISVLAIQRPDLFAPMREDRLNGFALWHRERSIEITDEAIILTLSRYHTLKYRFDRPTDRAAIDGAMQALRRYHQAQYDQARLEDVRAMREWFDGIAKGDDDDALA